MVKPRVVLATYMVRFPLGGNLSWAMQYIMGLVRAGCDVTVVEWANYPQACFDPVAKAASDDPATGLGIVRAVLDRHDLADRFCFVDVHGRHSGLSEADLRRRFEEADVFIDSGNHGAWADLAAGVPRRVVIDGEPGFSQVRCLQEPARARTLGAYTHHFSNGLLLDTDQTRAPTLGYRWRPFANPVCVDLFDHAPPPGAGAPWTTIMNWQSHKPLEHEGQTLGQKDRSFAAFHDLPTRTQAPIEVAVAGAAPRERLTAAGWRIASARGATATLQGYCDYIRGSMGEFSVAKHVFVALRTGWFSDRSAAYLASGRPVILQDTGFSQVLPTGEGLFAADGPEDAAAAIEAVHSDYARHSRAAREIAHAHLDAGEAFRQLLAEVDACGAA